MDYRWNSDNKITSRRMLLMLKKIWNQYGFIVKMFTELALLMVITIILSIALGLAINALPKSIWIQ